MPASFCGVFGLKPTFGRLPRTGTFPFVHDLDHLGPFARSVSDLALTYDAIQGHDPGDPACVPRPAEYASAAAQLDIEGLRAWRARRMVRGRRKRTMRSTAVRRVAEAMGPVTEGDIA